MGDTTRRVRITVTDEFSQTLGAFTLKMGEAAKVAEGAGQKAETGFQKLARGATDLANAGTVLYQSFSKPFNIANQFADMAREGEKARIAIEKLSGGKDKAQEWTDAIKTGLMGTVTEAEAARQAYQLMRLELAKTPEEAQKFARMMAIVSAANPMLGDTSEAISQIALTISNMSYMRLDQLGISAGKVRGRVAELKNEFRGMSTEEAFKTAVFEELNKQASTLGDEILMVDSHTKALAVSFAELKTDVGYKIAEGFEAAAFSISAASEILKYALGDTEAQKLADWERMAAEGVRPDQQMLGMSARDRERLQGAIQVNPNILKERPELYFATDQGREYADWYYQQYPTAKYAKSPWQATQDITRQLKDVRPLSDMQFQSAYYNNRVEMARRRKEADYWKTNDQALMDFYAYQDQQQYEKYTVPKQRELLQTVNPRWFMRQAQLGLGGGMMDFFSGKEGVNITAMQGAAGMANVAAAIGDAANNMAQLGAAATQVEAKFGSLEEKFGTMGLDFQADVLKDVEGALKDAGVEEEAAASAMDRYQLLTGLANAQSELFASSLASITEQYKAGQITADEYAVAVDSLSKMDLSNIDAMLAPMKEADFTGFTSMIDTLKGFDPESLKAINELPATMAEGAKTLADNLFGLVAGGGEGEEGPTDPFSAMAANVHDVDETLAAAQESWPGYIEGALATGQENFSTFADHAVDQIARIKAELQGLGDFNLNVNLNTSGGGKGKTQNFIPHMALGGALSGGQLAEINEWGAPEAFTTRSGRTYMIAPPGGGLVSPMMQLLPYAASGAGGPSNTVIKLLLDGKEVYQAVAREGTRRNAPVARGM
jgi:hypothetical protein